MGQGKDAKQQGRRVASSSGADAAPSTATVGALREAFASPPQQSNDEHVSSVLAAFAKHSALTEPVSTLGQSMAKAAALTETNSALAAFAKHSPLAGLGRGATSEEWSGLVAAGAAVRTFAEGLAATNLRLLDVVVPSPLAGLELATTARLARLVDPGSSLAGWRGSLLAEHGAAALAGSMAMRPGQDLSESLAGLGRSAAAAARLSEFSIGSRSGVASWPSGLPASLFGEFVHGLGPGCVGPGRVRGRGRGPRRRRSACSGRAVAVRGSEYGLHGGV